MIQHEFELYGASLPEGVSAYLFAKFLIDFIIFFLRVATLFSLGHANRGTLVDYKILLLVIAALIIPLIIYTFYSVHKYFGMMRATGIDHFDPVYLEAGDSLLKRRSRFPLEPGRRAPSIIAGGGYQSVMHGILINVLQPRIIRTFIRDVSVVELIPNLAAGCLVKLVKPLADV